MSDTRQPGYYWIQYGGWVIARYENGRFYRTTYDIGHATADDLDYIEESDINAINETRILPPNDIVSVTATMPDGKKIELFFHDWDFPSRGKVADETSGPFTQEQIDILLSRGNKDQHYGC